MATATSPQPAPPESSLPVTIQDSATGAALEVMDHQCYLLRDLLSLEEQEALFQYIEDKDQTPWATLPRVMVPSPKTLLFGPGQPNLSFEFGECSVVTDMVEKANEIMGRNDLCESNSSEGALDLCQYKSLSMAAIRYHAPDGRFPPHIDHCDNSFVYLMSLGCTANFMIKTPAMDEERVFKFRSGDLLVFNASSAAAVLHGVLGIDDDGSCPVGLSSSFPVLEQHRYGVQCRLTF